MTNNSAQFISGKDYAAKNDYFAGIGTANVTFRGLQADLNLFAKSCGFEAVVIDGLIGDKTLAAANTLVNTAVAKDVNKTPDFFRMESAEEVAKNATAIRDWVRAVAGPTLQITTVRTYLRGDGKDWNVKGDIAYGAGIVHDEFKGLQADLNGLAQHVGFAKLNVDGFLGPKTAAAVKKTYDATVKKNAFFGITMFPVPDTKEEVAEFCMMIREWIKTVAVKNLVAEAAV
jgi:lysozyme family protein